MARSAEEFASELRRLMNDVSGGNLQSEHGYREDELRSWRIPGATLRASYLIAGKDELLSDGLINLVTPNGVFEFKANSSTSEGIVFMCDRSGEYFYTVPVENSTDIDPPVYRCWGRWYGPDTFERVSPELASADLSSFILGAVCTNLIARYLHKVAEVNAADLETVAKMLKPTGDGSTYYKGPMVAWAKSVGDDRFNLCVYTSSNLVDDITVLGNELRVSFKYQEPQPLFAKKPPPAGWYPGWPDPDPPH